MNTAPRTARDYQVAAKDAIRDGLCNRDLQGVVVEAFTGAGKSFVIADMAKDIVLGDLDNSVTGRAGNVLIAVNRDNLCNQLFDSLECEGLHPMMEKGLERALINQPSLFGGYHHRDCIVASIQSIQNERLLKFAPDHFELVITDECHFAKSAKGATFVNVLEHFKSARHVGVTATLQRHDECGLWKGFQECVFSITMQEGINEGWLVPFSIESLAVPIEISAKKAEKKMWTEDDEQEALNKHFLTIYQKVSEKVKSCHGLMFWNNCKISEEASRFLANKGINSRHIEGPGGPFNMSKDQIQSQLDWFKERGNKCLSNVELLSFGYDNPSIDLLAIIRVTRSIPKIIQQTGRATRPNCVVDGLKDAAARREAIAMSCKPRFKILDLTLNVENAAHNFATASSLITSDHEERVFIDQELKKGRAISIESLEGALKTRRESGSIESARARMAEEIANAALRAQSKLDGPYVADIFSRFPGKGIEASNAQWRYLVSLGCKLPREGITKVQAVQLINRYKQYKEKNK